MQNAGFTSRRFFGFIDEYFARFDTIQGTKTHSYHPVPCASFGGQNYFAQVEGDAIKCGEQVMSPSRFANLRGIGNRNAWKAVWLRLAGAEEWLLTDVFRSARR